MGRNRLNFGTFCEPAAELIEIVGAIFFLKNRSGCLNREAIRTSIESVETIRIFKFQILKLKFYVTKIKPKMPEFIKFYFTVSILPE